MIEETETRQPVIQGTEQWVAEHSTTACECAPAAGHKDRSVADNQNKLPCSEFLTPLMDHF